MTTSRIIPNSYQTPNHYCDHLMHLLDGDEWKTLSYATRRTMGFGQRSARMSQNDFRKGNGLRDVEGRPVEHGTGLSRDKQRQALQNLVAFGILVQVNPFHRVRQLGAEYELQLDENMIDWEGLEARKMHKEEMERNRTRKARKAAAEALSQPVDNVGETVDNSPSSVSQTRGGVVCETDQPSSVPQTTPTSVAQATPRLWDSRVLETKIETKIETKKETQGGVGGAGKKRSSKARANGRKKGAEEGDEGLEMTWAKCLAFCKGDMDTAVSLWKLQKHFSETTTLPVDLDTPTGRRQLERDWWPYLQQVLTNAGGDVEEAMVSITEAVKRMDQAKLSCTSPRSVVKMAAAALAERRRGVDQRQPEPKAAPEPRGYQALREYMQMRGLSAGGVNGD